MLDPMSTQNQHQLPGVPGNLTGVSSLTPFLVLTLDVESHRHDEGLREVYLRELHRQLVECTRETDRDIWCSVM